MSSCRYIPLLILLASCTDGIATTQPENGARNSTPDTVLARRTPDAAAAEVVSEAPEGLDAEFYMPVSLRIVATAGFTEYNVAYLEAIYYYNATNLETRLTLNVQKDGKPVAGPILFESSDSHFMPRLWGEYSYSPDMAETLVSGSCGHVAQGSAWGKAWDQAILHYSWWRWGENIKTVSASKPQPDCGYASTGSGADEGETTTWNYEVCFYEATIIGGWLISIDEKGCHIIKVGQGYV